MNYILAYDVGTTGVKTCLFEVGEEIRLVDGATRGYPLYIMDDGGAEQDVDDWWNAMCESTKELFSKVDTEPSEIKGISFCSQMQGLVLVDKDGKPVHRPMSYMDQRAVEEYRKGIANGIQIGGANIFKAIPSIIITGAIPGSVKDPVWKYNWVKNREPENYARIYKWLDVKDYLILRCTGRFVMTRDSAFATMIFDSRKGHMSWSKKMNRMTGVDERHLPDIIKSTDMAGKLTAEAARELGLCEGTPVFGGGGDSSLIGIGAGSVKVGDTHIYSGTSGWVSTVTDGKKVDATSMVAAIVGAEEDKYNYFAEMETAGKCLEWVKDHLALDEIGIYLEKKHVAEDRETRYTSLYEYLTETVSRSPAGSNGVIFTPWLHGNRCPFEDSNAAGIFFNVKLENGKTDMIRAVLEGICYHLRWMLECEDKKVRTSSSLRFVGGGALSAVTCQMLSDVTGRRIETVPSSQNVGSVGAAAVAAVGLGLIRSLDDVGEFIRVDRVYEPNPENQKVYDKNFAVFKALYNANKNLYKRMNAKKA